jgi:hypothetical protein
LSFIALEPEVLCFSITVGKTGITSLKALLFSFRGLKKLFASAKSPRLVL